MVNREEVAIAKFIAGRFDKDNKTVIALAKNIKRLQEKISEIEKQAPEFYKKSSDDLDKIVVKVEKLISESKSESASAVKKQTESLSSSISKLSKELNRIESRIESHSAIITSIKNAKDGLNGKDGKDGMSGRGIEDALIKNDSLILKLTDGTELNVGKIVPDVPLIGKGRKGAQGEPGKSVEIYYSTTDPTSGDGNDGALWVKYTE